MSWLVSPWIGDTLIFPLWRKSYSDHTVGMMRIIPSLCYTMVTVEKSTRVFAMTEHNEVQIRVQGWINERWADWFDGMTMTYEGTKDDSPVTVLTGPIIDQAALRGILTKIWDLNLTVISVNRIESEGGKSNE